MTKGAASVFAVWVCASLVAGCGPKTTPSPAQADEHTPQPAARNTLAAVALPDLSGAAKSVETQLRDQYTVLTRKIDDPSTAAIDLAAAYGEMGKLDGPNTATSRNPACSMRKRSAPQECAGLLPGTFVRLKG